MKKAVSILVFVYSCIIINAQVSQGFNYQAIARDITTGTPIVNTQMQVRFTIQADSLGGTVFWQELHPSVTTNSFGLISVILGKGQRVTGAVSFSSIDWSVTPKFIKTEVYYNSGWKTMGSSRLWSVPYAMVAGDLDGPVKKLTVAGATALNDEALFDVKNKNGQTIFAVYNEGVRIYVDDGAKGSKGGFAVGGFDMAKATKREYLVVSDDSIRMYIDSNPATKGTKGGFAVGGYDITKGTIPNFLNLTPENYFIGHQAGVSNTTGLYNSFIGFQSGYMNTTGSNNSFLGYLTGYGNTEGFGNTFIGNQAGYSNSSGIWNVFIGENAGVSNTTASRSVFIGPFSGRYNTTGDANVFIGQQTGEANTTGSFNLFAGRAAGNFNTTGLGNTFLGINAGNANTTGNLNIMLGGESGKWNNSGSYNVNLGWSAGVNNTDGNYNVMLGYYSGSALTSGTGNVLIGPFSGGNEANISNKLYIENSNAGPASALIYGDFSTDYLRFNATTDFIGKVSIGAGTASPSTKLDIAGGNNWDLVNGDGDLRIGNPSYGVKMGVALGGGGAGAVGIMQYGQTGGYNVLSLGALGRFQLYINGTTNSVGIGTDSPGYKLTVNGTAWCSAGSWTGSDIRWKKNIEVFDNALSGILSLQTVNYNLRTDEFPEMGFESGRQIGLIAQDVEKIFPVLVNTDNNGYKAVAYDKLSAVLVEGMKEQQRQIEAQQKEIDELKTLVKRLITSQTAQVNK